MAATFHWVTCIEGSCCLVVWAHVDKEGILDMSDGGEEEEEEKCSIQNGSERWRGGDVYRYVAWF